MPPPRPRTPPCSSYLHRPARRQSASLRAPIRASNRPGPAQLSLAGATLIAATLLSICPSVGVDRAPVVRLLRTVHVRLVPYVHLCAVNHPNDDTGTCNGDSGGPLIAADSNDN